MGLRAAVPQVRRILAHEWTLAALTAVLISLFINRAALADPAHTLPQDIWDPSLVAYLIAWGGHALLHDPTNVWQLNTFYPAPYGLAYTDSLLAYAPAAIIGTGPEAAILRYNILFILAQALVLFGGYALARQLGVGRIGAAVAGVAVAVAPWRLAQAGHLQVLSVGGMFLALAMLARGHGVRWRRRADRPADEPTRIRPGWALAGWLVATWQLAIGFGIGLTFLYVLLGAMLVGIVAWAVRRRPLPSWRLLVADAGGGLVFSVVAILLALPYTKVLELYPYTKRDASWVALYSPPVNGLFTAPAESILWGDAHQVARAQLSIPGEMALLPGFALYALAAAGLFFSVWPLLTRLALGIGAVAALALSLGTHGPADGELGYLLLLHLPGFEGLRTPGRLMLWATLLLALLAAGSVGALVDLVQDTAERRGEERPPFWAGLALLVPVLLVFVEGLGTTPHAVVPAAPPSLSTVAGPVLVLPTDQVGDMPVMLWSTDRFVDMVNGGSGVVPIEQDQIRRAVVNFPDQASVGYLRGVGVQTVLVVRSMVGDGSYQQFSAMPVDALGVTREVRPDAVVFSLN
jgi:hypothetical protein